MRRSRVPSTVGIVLSFHKCIEALDTAKLPKTLRVDLICHLKLLELRSLRSQDSQDVTKYRQRTELESKIRPTIQIYKALYEDENSGLSCFWRHKGLHALSTVEIVHDWTSKLLKAAPGDATSSGNGAMFDVLNCLAGDSTATTALLGAGVANLVQGIKDQKQMAKVDARAIAVEAINSVVCAHGDVNRATLSVVVGEVTNLFVRLRGRLQNKNDWLLLYNYVDTVLNAAMRSNTPGSDDALQMAALAFFKSQLPFKPKKRQQLRGGLSSTALKNVSKVIEAQIVRAVALINNSTVHQSVKAESDKIIREVVVGSKKKPINGAHYLGPGRDPANEFILPDLVVLDMHWHQLVENCCEKLQAAKPSLVEEALSCSNDSTLNKAVIQHIAISAPNIHKLVDEFSKKSFAYNKDHFWYCFCKRLVCERQLASTRPVPNDMLPPKPPATRDDASVFRVSCLAPEEPILENEGQPKQSREKESADLSMDPPAPVVRKQAKVVSADDFDPLVYNILEDSESAERSIEDSITCIRSIVAVSRKVNAEASGCNMVAILGATGSGKSTVINWLNGCTMVRDDQNNIAVRTPDQGGAQEPISTIGHDAHTSQTIVPFVFPLDNSLSLCDCPGFIESRGTEIAIANAINTQSVVSNSRSVSFLQIINVYELMAARSDSARQSLQSLVLLFGGAQNFNRCTAKIAFGLNFVSDSPSLFARAKTRLLTLCEKNGWRIAEENIFAIDPLAPRTRTVGFLRAMSRIPSAECAAMFTQAPLSEKEMLLLGKLNDAMMEWCASLWARGDAQGLLDSYVLLEDMSQLSPGQTMFHQQLENIRKFIKASVGAFAEEEIIVLVQQPMSRSRHTAVSKQVDKLKGYTALDTCFASTDDSAPISALVTETLDRIAQLEASEQKLRNEEFTTKWKTLCLVFEKELDESIRNKPDALSNIDLLTNINQLGNFLEVCPFVQKITEMIAQVETEEKERVTLFFSGNLRPLVDLKEQIESRTTEIIRGRLRTVKCQRLMQMCVSVIGDLEEQIGLVETKYDVILGMELSDSADCKEDILLYGIKSLEHVGFERTAIAKLLNLLPALKEVCCMDPAWPEKYESAIGRTRQFVGLLNKEARAALVVATYAQFKLDLDSFDVALVASLDKCTSFPDSLMKYLDQTPSLSKNMESVKASLGKLEVDPAKHAAAQEEWERKQKELTVIMKRCVSENILNETEKATLSLNGNCNDPALVAQVAESVAKLDAVHAKKAREKIQATFVFNYTLNGNAQSHAAATEDFNTRGRMARSLYSDLGMEAAVAELDAHKKALVENEERILHDVRDQISKSASNVLEVLRLGLAQFAEATDKSIETNLTDIDIEEHLFNEGFVTINTKEKVAEMQTLIAEAKDALHFLPTTELDGATEQLKKLVRDVGEETARFNAHFGGLQLAEKTRKDMETLIARLERNLESKCFEFSTKPITLGMLSENEGFISEATTVLDNMHRLHADSPEQARIVHSEFKKRTEDIKSRAQRHLCQELGAKIDHWCVADEVAGHVDEVKGAFDLIRLYSPTRYEQQKVTFLAFCNSKQEEGTILSHIKAKNYNAIFSSFKLLTKLQLRLQDHVAIDLHIDNVVGDFLDEQFAKAKENLSMSVDNDEFLDFSDLKDFMEFSRSLRKPGQVENLKRYARDMFSNFSKNCFGRKRNSSATAEQQLQDLVDTVAKTFVKYFAVATELDMVPEFTKEMNTFLANTPPEKADLLSKSIYQLHSIPTLEKICGDILSRFKVFSRVNTAIENRIRGGVTFDVALRKLTSNQTVDKESLRAYYRRYREVFDKILDDIIQGQYNQNEKIRSMRALAKDIKPFKRRSKQTCFLIAELVARVCAHYSFHDAQDTYFTGDKDTLLQVHATQVLSIFTLLGLDQAGGAPVGTINEVLTGEGKSISLAMTAAAFCFMGVEARIVCYSTYLTHKDSVLFAGYFRSMGIKDKVQYSTIDSLVNSVMSKSFPDLRQQVETFLMGNRVPKFNSSGSNAVLLIDEVDIFFGPDFYGQLYQPGFNMKSPEAFEMMKYLWTNRAWLLGMSQDDAVAHVMQQQTVVQNFLGKYPQSEMLLKPFIHSCLVDLRRYFASEGSSSLECEVCDDRIGVMDLSVGSLVFTRIGPKYSFAHFFYNEQMKPDGTKYISDLALEDNVGITVSCGYILYAEMPKLFRLILGVTGTLVSFGDDHKEILNNFGLRRLMNVPSTFQRQPLVVKPTTVVTGDRGDAYFDRIKSVIYDMVKAHRATLVFFETSAELQQFKKQLERKTIKLPNYRVPEKLCESVAPDKRDAIINRAINTNRVTLCTKTYMRGTDFKCRDSELSSLGGVHVLMTFLPETAADEVQAQGRTCRQNDPGSYQKILFAQDLVDKNMLRTRMVDGIHVPDLSEADELILESDQAEEKRWDYYLEKKRANKEVETAKSIMSNLNANSPTHTKTLEMSRLMMENSTSSAPRAMEILASFQ